MELDGIGKKIVEADGRKSELKFDLDIENIFQKSFIGYPMEIKHHADFFYMGNGLRCH